MNKYEDNLDVLHDRIKDLEQREKMYRRFAKKYERWATSEEHCSGRLFDGMVMGYQELEVALAKLQKYT